LFYTKRICYELTRELNVGSVHEIYIAPEGSAPMQQMQEVEAVANCGLRGDRYCERLGYYTGWDECQLTLIEAEDLEEIARNTGLHVLAGEHRRNIVTRDVRLAELTARPFRVGEAVLAFDRPRPPCAYIQSITEAGMTRALMGKAGICAMVVAGGMIRQGDAIMIL
jgi:MOSC domain-containing protein YiiM